MCIRDRCYGLQSHQRMDRFGGRTPRHHLLEPVDSGAGVAGPEQIQVLPQVPRQRDVYKRQGCLVRVLFPQRCGGTHHNVGHTHNVQHRHIVIIVAKSHHIGKGDVQSLADAAHTNALVGKGGVDPVRSRYRTVRDVYKRQVKYLVNSELLFSVYHDFPLRKR